MADKVEGVGDAGGGPMVSVKVTDVFGLSTPIQKMIEYTCKGFGILYKPTQIRR